MKQTKLIPNIIHLAWFGGKVSKEEHIKNIYQWRSLNPDYTIILWVALPEDVKLITKQIQTQEYDIKIQDINSVCNTIKNYPLILEQLALKNYSTASDILRIDLITYYGGYYWDIGITPEKSIHTCFPKGNSFCHLILEQQSITRGYNHFHAATPNHRLYVLTQLVIQELLQNEAVKSLLHSKNPTTRYKTTVYTTGAAIFIARDIFIKKNQEYSNIIAQFDVNELGLPKKLQVRKEEGTDDQFEYFCQHLYPLLRIKTILKLGISFDFQEKSEESVSPIVKSGFFSSNETNKTENPTLIHPSTSNAQLSGQTHLNAHYII